MKRRLLLDVVVLKCPAILELLAGEDEPLLVRRDALPVLDLLLNVFNGIAWLDIDRDRLTCQGLDEELHRRDGGGASERTGEEDEA